MGKTQSLGWKIGFILSVFLILTACGGGGSGGTSTGSTATASTAISGSSFKGIISNAVVEVYDFSNNSKGELLATGSVINSEFNLGKVGHKGIVLLEVKKGTNNLASYTDEDSGAEILFNDLVLKAIISDPTDSTAYVATPLTTLAVELVSANIAGNSNEAYQLIAKLFGFSFQDIHKIKPNVAGIDAASTDSIENEYALALLSLVALQNEIDRSTNKDFTFSDLMGFIVRDLSDGVFDGKENGADLVFNDTSGVLIIGDIPIKLSESGGKSLQIKNPVFFNTMKGYYLRASTASRTIEPPIIAIETKENIRLNEKSILSAQGSESPFNYPLTYTWSIKEAPTDAKVLLATPNDVNCFITVDAEGSYKISLEVSDGQNRVSKDVDIIADLDGDGVLSGVDNDNDGDGIINANDAFPNDPSEFLDADSDGNGNFIQQDEDKDGVDDYLDDYPFDANTSQIITFNETEFNGNLNDANVLSGNIPYRITGTIYASGSDDDYFKFSSGEGDLITVSLVKTNDLFSPVISVVDGNGNSLPSINKISDNNKVFLSFRTPIDGNFYLIINDKDSFSSTENTYTATIFKDSDLDGISDYLEESIGSNKNSSDTDSDGIKDYYEVNTASFDVDFDGIPNWLDSDSDNDTIADRNETLTDSDNDDLLDPYDTDSDGNGTDDAIEVGTNPDVPDDYDGDGYSNYTDTDDDNDGVLDVNDNNRLLAADIDQDSLISSQGIIYGNKIRGFSLSKGTLEISGNNFSDDSLVILKSVDGIYNISPSSVTDTLISFVLPEIIGKVEIRIFSDSKLTISTITDVVAVNSPVIFSVDYPNGQNYALENDSIILSGINLSEVNTVTVNGRNINADSSSSNTVTFSINDTLSSGQISVSTLNDSSNDLEVFIGRVITGNVTLPKNSTYNVSDLKIDFMGISYPINSDGSFSLIAKSKESSSITIYSTDNTSVSVYLSALVLSDENNVVVDSASTASDIMFSAFNGESSDEVKKKSLIEAIRENIGVFSDNLENNLGSNPLHISEASLEYIAALTSSKNNIYDILKSNNILESRSFRISGIKVNEKDGFSVYKDGDPINGKIEIQNDTMLFADYQIKDVSNGKIIKSYANEFYSPNLLEPQYSGFFLYLSSSHIKDVSYKSSKVTVLTPKFRGMTFDNFNKRPEHKLAIRTLVSQGIMPILTQVIPIPSSGGNDCEKALLDAVFLASMNIDVAQLWAAGEIGKGFTKYLDSMIKVFLEEGTKSIIKGKLVGCLYGGATDEALAKYLSKITTKLIGFAVPTKAVSLAGTAVDLGWVVFDFATVENTIDFNVNFPVQIEEIFPTSVKKDGSSKEIYVQGRGLGKFCSNYDWEHVTGTIFPPKYEEVCKVWHKPKIKIVSGNEVREVYLSKNADGVYYFPISAGFIESATGKIKVALHHHHLDTQQINEVVPIVVQAPTDISIVEKLEITNLTPDSGGANTQVTISGAGLSSNAQANVVYFTTSTGSVAATVVDASESQIKVQVPQGAITGDIWVQVENEESNHLTFTVSTTKLTITFGDNGGVNDDTFSLEFEGNTIKTMSAPTRVAYGEVELTKGQIYTVKLKGITAPDAIGTYYISFPSEIEVISGGSLSGSDLTAGVVKSWKVKLAETLPVSGASVSKQSIKASFSKVLQLQPEER